MQQHCLINKMAFRAPFLLAVCLLKLCNCYRFADSAEAVEGESCEMRSQRNVEHDVQNERGLLPRAAKAQRRGQCTRREVKTTRLEEDCTSGGGPRGATCDRHGRGWTLQTFFSTCQWRRSTLRRQIVPQRLSKDKIATRTCGCSGVHLGLEARGMARVFDAAATMHVS